jgi:PAS domain S-box-containing protein
MTDDTVVPPAVAEHARSLETLEDFFENGVVGLHLVAGDGTILRANQAELDLLGYGREEYVGRTIADFHADADAIADILSRLSRGERLDRYRARLRHKDGSIRHVLISSSVLFRDGAFINTRCFTIDVTDQVHAEAALKAEQARLRMATHAARVGVWEWNVATGEMLYSPEAKAICGFEPEQTVTLDQVSAITHPDDFKHTWPMARRALDPALRENVPYEYRIVRPDGELRWVLAHGQAIFDGDGPGAQALRYVGAIQDITERVEAARSLETSQARLRLAMEAAQMAVWDSDRGSVVEMSTELARRMDVAQLGPVTLDDLRLRYFPGEGERVQAAARAAFQAGKPSFEAEYRYRRPDDTPGWLLVRAEFEQTPEDGPPKATGVLIDITARKQAELALHESEERLRALADNLPNGMIYQMISAPDGERRFTFVSSNCLRLNGIRAEVALSDASAMYALIHPDDAPGLAAAEAEAIASGRAFDHEVRMGRQDGTWRWNRLSSAPRRSADGAVLWDGIQIDVDTRRQTQDRLREETRALQILNRAGAAVAADVQLDEVVQTVIDGGVELTGAAFGAFFYNVLDDQGARYTLYTLSGAPREAFENFPMPRATEIFAPTFNGEGVVISKDILLDPRYGKSPPYHGMPQGHLPVRSYLAVSVRSRTGTVLGGLFFGHPDPARFEDRHADLIAGLASQAAVAIDNAELFNSAQSELAQRRKAEAELQTLNATLEDRVVQEVQERSKTEEALRQAQKMEAVGQLTGGVAHDFNNLLTVIIGGLDTIIRSKPGDEVRIQRAAAMALQGAERAADLTTRLLAFSRRQPLKPSPADLNLLMRNTTELLHRTLGETVELEGVLSPRLWLVEVDPNQLESAILNLALNARDAMPAGGKLTIETANASLDESYRATDAEVLPGQYVLVSVSDTGAGMDADTTKRVFEPFFTTKEVGKGTGLGLSMVYGFVKQSGGHVTIYSEPGQGTTVKLYFPRYLGGSAGEDSRPVPQAPLGHGDEVVLVVEDSDDVRAYSVMVLNELGYSVLEAANADAGLEIIKGDQRIDLLFTDVVLPGKSGRELAEAAHMVRPELRVLFTTGYSRNAIVHHGRLDAGVHLLSKPFTFEQLAARVRDVLDDRA